MRTRIAFSVGVLLLATLVVILAALVHSPSGQATTWPFATLTPVEMGRAGVTLSSPTRTLAALAPAPVSARVAGSAASKAMGDAKALEVRYVHCSDTWAVPNIDQNCYAVSVDPASVPLMGSANMPQPKATWGLVMIDPSTGAVIDERGGN
ncbi:MAG TPA: hypothetical protein VKT78_00990 [Fimbriimonadaceae bacterium]|nr:hypothetical protein [Fimbriimonadaceae bacterium]